MRVLHLVFCAVSLLSFVKSQSCQAAIERVEVICSRIGYIQWGSIGSQLTCEEDRSITSTFPDSSVSSVVHSNNRSEVTNLAEITALSIEYATVKFIPNGIQSKFINLQVLLIHSCGLLSVNKEDLRQFGNSLDLLDLGDNKLTSIAADLFEYNANLKLIGLYRNPLRHIEPEFFTNLKNLKSLTISDLNPAGCISQRFQTSSGHNIATFKWDYERCFNETARIETQLAPINARVQQSLNNELCLKEENAELQAQMTKMSKKFEKFKCQMSSMDAKLEILIQHIMNP